MAQQFEPLFGATVNEVNVNAEGSTREQIRAKDIAASKGDAFDVSALMGQTAKVMEAERMKEANTAKADWTEFYMSEQFRQAPSSIRVEMIENKINSLTDRSDAYINGFKGYASSSYAREYERRNEEEDTSMLNSAGAYAKDYMLRINPDTIGTPEGERTNADTGKTMNDAVEHMILQNPRLDRNAIKNSLLTDLYEGFYDDIDNARTVKELVDIQQDIIKEKEPYNTDKFLLTNGKKGKEAVRAYESEMARRISLKEAEFVMNAKNDISRAREGGYNETAQDLDDRFQLIHTDKKTGKLDELQYNKDVQKYEKDRYDYKVYESYVETFDPTQQLSFETKDNKEVKKIHSKNIAASIGEQIMMGNLDDFVNTTTNNAEYLKDAKAVINSQLFKTDGDPKVQDAIWAKLDDIIQSPTGYTSMKKIMGNDIEKLEAVLAAERFGGYDRATSIERVNKWKDNPDEYKMQEKKVQELVIEGGLEYGPLNDEFKSIVMMSVAAGVDPKNAVQNIREKFDNMKTEVGGTIAYSVAGEAPTVSPNAEDAYNDNVELAVKIATQKNGGNPVYLEIMNNGMAIPRDAIFGHRVKIGEKGPGFINLKAIALESETKAMNEGAGWWDRTKASIQEITGFSMNMHKYLTDGEGADEAITAAQGNRSDYEKSRDNTPVLQLGDSEIERNIIEQAMKLFGEVDMGGASKKATEGQGVVTKEAGYLINSVFKAEGGYQNDPADSGNYYMGQMVGTNQGISAPVLAEYLGRTPTEADMKKLTKEDAYKIYKKNYYDKYSIGKLPVELREIVFHGVVNGGDNGIKALQKVLGVNVDGVIGAKTIEAVKNSGLTKADYAKALLYMWKDFRGWNRFGRGWTERFMTLARK